MSKNTITKLKPNSQNKLQIICPKTITLTMITILLVILLILTFTPVFENKSATAIPAHVEFNHIDIYPTFCCNLYTNGVYSESDGPIDNHFLYMHSF